MCQSRSIYFTDVSLCNYVSILCLFCVGVLFGLLLVFVTYAIIVLHMGVLLLFCLYGLNYTESGMDQVLYHLINTLNYR